MCAVLALGLGGCGILGCDEQVEVVELDYDWMGTGGPAPLDQYALDLYRDSGYACHNDGAIRNAAGTPIGDRWVCTRCD